MLQKINRFLLLSVLFTMPSFIRLNIILVFLFVVISFVEIAYSKRWKTLKNNIKFSWPIAVFFILVVIAFFNNTVFLPFKKLETFLLFLFIPLVFLSNPKYYVSQKIYIFKALILGVVLSLLVCFGNAVYEMITNQEPFSYFFRWRHTNIQFTEIIGVHPPYLGLFAAVSLYYLLFHKPFNRIWTVIVFLILVFGLFQMAARVAIFIGVIILLIYTIRQLQINKRNALIIIVVLIFIGVFFYINASKVLAGRLFSIENIIEDNRFKRVEASFNVFKEYPILGVGFSKVDSERRENYKELGDIIAYLDNHNAHNQLLEYLVINGLLGGFVYLLVFIFLINSSFRNKDFLFLMIFVVFFVSNLTDSMMQRLLGVEFYSIFATLYMCNLCVKKS